LTSVNSMDYIRLGPEAYSRTKYNISPKNIYKVHYCSYRENAKRDNTK
jgi:hypothetical protein